jgi:hypothetical protein
MMPELANLSWEPFPSFALIEAIDDASTRTARAPLLRQLHVQNSRNRAALNDQRGRIENFLRQLAQTHLTAGELASVQAQALEKRKIEREEMRPAFERLHRTVELHANVRETAVQRAFCESIDIAAAWLAINEELTNKLFEFAARNDPDKKVLHARPIQGEIDHTALSQEFMERFPNIRAALAK